MVALNISGGIFQGGILLWKDVAGLDGDIAAQLELAGIAAEARARASLFATWLSVVEKLDDTRAVLGGANAG